MKRDELTKVLQCFIDVFDKMIEETEDGTIDYWEDVYDNTLEPMKPKPQKEGDTY